MDACGTIYSHYKLQVVHLNHELKDVFNLSAQSCAIAHFNTFCKKTQVRRHWWQVKEEIQVEDDEDCDFTIKFI